MESATLQQVQAFHPPLTLASCCRAVQASQPGKVPELGVHRHPRIQSALLRHVAEDETRVPVHGLPVPPHRSAIELHETEDAAHARRLACSVTAEEAEDTAPVHAEAAAVKSDGLTVGLAQAMDLQQTDLLPVPPTMVAYV